MSRRSFLRPLFLALLFLVPIAHAKGTWGQAAAYTPDPGGKAIFWPSTHPAPFAVSLHRYTFDGVKMADILLRSDVFQFTIPLRSNFVAVKTGNPRFSLSFLNRDFPDAELDFAVFSSEQFLSSPGSGPWHEYLNGLARKHQFGFEVTADQVWGLAGPSVQTILECPNRILTYRFQTKKNGPVIERREFFVFFQGHVVVFRFEAPPAQFKTLLPSVESVVNRLHPLKD